MVVLSSLVMAQESSGNAEASRGPMDAIREAVAARMFVDPSDVVVRAMGDAPAGAEDCAAALPQVGPVYGSVSVTLYCDGQRFRLHPYVEVWRTVPVAADRAAAGAVVAVVLERVSSERLRGEEPLGDRPGTVWRARVDLERGEPLVASRVAPLPDAARGSEVRIVALAGGLRIEAAGELLQDTFIDQPSAARNLATQTVVRGVYLGDGTLLIGRP